MRYILLLLLAFQLQGCVMQARRADNGGFPTYDGVSDTYPGDAQSLASKAADELALRYPPGRSALTLAKVKTTFGQGLDSELRQRGFMVAAPESPAGIRVGYTLDVIQDQSPPTCYLQFRTSDGQTFGLVHTLSMAELAPKQELPSKAPASSLESSSLPDEPTLPAPSPAQPHPDRIVPGSKATDRQSPEPVTPPQHSDGVPVRSKAMAEQIAKRNHLPVADFCRWNGVTPRAMLEKGRLVYLSEHSAVTPAAPAKAEIVAKERQAKPVASSTPAPRPASVMPVQEAATATKPDASSPSVASPARDATPAASVSAQAPAPAVQEALAELSHKGTEPVAATTSTETDAPAPTWIINPGSLHMQLESWSHKARYQLVWKAKHDFELESKASFSGEFVDAIKQLFAGLNRGGNALRVTVYQGNNVLEVAED